MDELFRKSPLREMIVVIFIGFISLCLFSCKPAGDSKRRGNAIPERIISLSPSYTEILFALGLGGKVVAVSDFCEYPDEARRLPKVGGVLNPSLERALGFRPDLVILMKTQAELIGRYESLGMRTLPLLTDRLQDLYQGIEEIGRATGAVEASQKLAARIKADLSRVEEKTRGRPRPRAMLVAGHQPGDLREVYVAGPSSFMGALLAVAGGDNVFGDLRAPWSNVSVESILEKDPEVIIVTSIKKTIADQDRLAEKEIWSRLPTLAAVKSGRVYLLPADPVTVPGNSGDTILNSFLRINGGHRFFLFSFVTHRLWPADGQGAEAPSEDAFDLCSSSLPSYTTTATEPVPNSVESQARRLLFS